MSSSRNEQTAYLALGGNVGDVRRAFDFTIGKLEKATGHSVRTSRLYRTAPWGETDQPDFLNMVVEIRWSGTPRDLLRLALEIEREQGRDRDREKRWGPRTLDIDLLVVGSTTLDEPELTLPHPRMQERTFVLAPLCDLAPNLVPSGWNESIQQTLDQRSDQDGATAVEFTSR